MDLNAITSKNEHYVLPIKEQNERLVRVTINKTDNPHPGLLAILLVIILVLVYYLYIVMIKRNFSGIWYVGDTKTKVKHNSWNDSLYINDVLSGHVDGNALYIGIGKAPKKHGVYGDKKIYWVESGEVWKRPVYAI